MLISSPCLNMLGCSFSSEITPQEDLNLSQRPIKASPPSSAVLVSNGGKPLKLSYPTHSEIISEAITRL